MKKTIKLLSIILAILMVISIIPLTASAATYSGTCGDDVTWVYDSSTYTLTIYGTGDMYDYESNNRPWESYEDKIKTVIINDCITSIGNYAFYHCGKMVTAILPDSVTTIGECAFKKCISLKSINIPNGIKTISHGIFNLCEELTEITLPDSVTEIGEYAFAGCYGLAEIIIPDNVTIIGYYAFGGCDALASVTIGSSVAKIDDSAFYSCKNLTTITIPKNVATIGNRAFADCENLTSIIVDKDSQYYMNDEYGALYNKDKTTLIQYPIGNTRTSYTIPDGVTTIGEMSFYNCASLISITLPDSIRIIEESAFNSCEGITNLIIPNGVTTIGYGAIRNCTNLKDITIPDSVTSIGDYAITQYSTLIHYGGTEKQWKQLMTNNPEAEYYLKNNMVYCTDKTVLPSGSCGDNLTWTYDIVTGILTISGAGDMYNFDSHPVSATDAPWSTYIYVINKIIIDDGVTSIGEYAFYGCSNLSDVIIGDGVTTIGENAFSYCDSLISVTIGNGVTTIKEYAFYECEGLTSVIIPVSVTNMDNDAFYGCPGITDVYYEGTEEQWLGYYVYPEGSLINLNRPFTKSTIHYNYHIHKYDSTVTPPTCTEQGYTTYTCECGDSYVDDYVDALGHTEETVSAIAPTCTATGFTEGVKCSVCDVTLTEQQELPQNGHTPADAVEENYVAPTCTENGSKDVVVYCSVCDEEISRETETIDATGHEDNDGDGYCDMDNELLDPSVECDHICHKDGILGFIWRIINVFNMFFGLNKTCDCAVAHY